MERIEGNATTDFGAPGIVGVADRKALTAAENVNHTMHNLYTLRGAKVRDARKWSGYIDDAEKRGANAIIIGEFKDPSTVDKIADAVVGVGGTKTGKVLAIRLKS